MNDSHTIRLGTRGSLLARRQSDWVARQLEQRHAGLVVHSLTINTSGDSITDRPLYEMGGKGLFVKEIEQALLAGKIDFAVHSFKDVPVTMPLVDQMNLTIAATPAREDPRDLLICRVAKTIEELPVGAAIGTGSLRRRCQLLALRPDLSIQPIRGNIDTRLRKLHAGEFDAIVLAMAGVRRAGLFEPDWMHVIAAAELLPAPGQGALALQCRTDDLATIKLLSSLNDAVTETCVTAERELVAALHGDCHSPIAALAEVNGQRLHFRAAVGARGGEPPVLNASTETPLSDWRLAVRKVHQSLIAQGFKGFDASGR